MLHSLKPVPLFKKGISCFARLIVSYYDNKYINVLIIKFLFFFYINNLI